MFWRRSRNKYVLIHHWSWATSKTYTQIENYFFAQGNEILPCIHFLNRVYWAHSMCQVLVMRYTMGSWPCRAHSRLSWHNWITENWTQSPDHTEHNCHGREEYESTEQTEGGNIRESKAVSCRRFVEPVRLLGLQSRGEDRHSIALLHTRIWIQLRNTQGPDWRRWGCGGRWNTISPLNWVYPTHGWPHLQTESARLH